MSGEVEILRRGAEIILPEKPPNMLRVLKLLAELLGDGRDGPVDDPPPARDGL